MKSSPEDSKFVLRPLSRATVNLLLLQQGMVYSNSITRIRIRTMICVESSTVKINLQLEYLEMETLVNCIDSAGPGESNQVRFFLNCFVYFQQSTYSLRTLPNLSIQHIILR